MTLLNDSNENAQKLLSNGMVQVIDDKVHNGQYVASIINFDEFISACHQMVEHEKWTATKKNYFYKNLVRVFQETRSVPFRLEHI